MTPKILFVFLVITIASCGIQGMRHIPDTFQGNWDRIPEEGISEEQSGMEFSLRIGNDTLVARQKVMGMAGIEQSLQRYTFEKITLENDSTLQAEIKDQRMPTYIRIIRSNGNLIITYCVSDNSEGKDINYTGCTEWGSFTRSR